MLLLRHAESEWNRVFGPTRIDAALQDPSITAEGAEATRAAAGQLRGRDVARIVTSPYRRTLQTSEILAEALGVPVTVDPDVRERCAFSCDQGTPADVLVLQWPAFDLAHLERRWWGRRIESMESLAMRARRFHERARAMLDRDRVLVVTHWGFIRCVTGEEVGNLATVRVHLDSPLPS